MYIAGVDEAGRGPVIGPMVMVVAAIDEKEEFELRTIGVKDSKLLSPIQRKELAVIINDICIVEHKIISPKEIDDAVNHPTRNLNVLEAEITGELINKIIKRVGENNIKEIVLDCPSINPKAYLEEIGKHVKASVKLIAEHKADKNHLIVGAASIIAKVIRDEEIKKLKQKHNIEFGSGYPSDETTINFLKKNYDKYDFFRKTWSTYKKAVAESSQKSLGTFINDKEEYSTTINEKKELLKKLLKEGFTIIETKNPSEVIRLKSPEATITLYTTGKILVQGIKKDYWDKRIKEMFNK